MRAIARGRVAIIVGDPKQLPPTSFFSRADAQDSDDGDLIEDLESILDDCLGADLPKADSALRTLIDAVVRQEGPISLEHLARRVAAHWDVSRRSSKIVKRIEAWATFEGVQKVIHDDRIFYWPDRQDPAGYRAFRIAGESEETCRKADDLPPEEVANAAHHVLKQAVSLPATGLVRDAARLMGFLRTGAAVSG